ncbi:MAG: glycosyltransferase family 4 protein [Polyangiaceae bacterium]
MTEPKRVLFVSKPIAPPWHDGSKNLVRDVASHLERAEPTVLTVPGAPSIGPRVKMEAVYEEGGRFTPALLANARVLARLLRGDAQDVWHFVFAPNAASSTAANVAIRARRALGWKGTVVQTIASAPRTFEGVSRFVFGDKVVALSEWTRGRLLGAGVTGRELVVIPPCARAPAPVDAATKAAVRRRYDLGEGPVILYPGDYEVSSGAATVARAVGAVVRSLPTARVVFACREKTPRARPAALKLQRELLDLAVHTRHVGEVDDMGALLGTADVVVFPVDDLYGKVDVPLVLLEALALGIPLVLARGGPLESIPTAEFVDPGDDAALARAVVAILGTEGGASPTGPGLARAGRDLYEARFTPAVVARAYEGLYV